MLCAEGSVCSASSQKQANPVFKSSIFFLLLVYSLLKLPLPTVGVLFYLLLVSVQLCFWVRKKACSKMWPDGAFRFTGSKQEALLTGQMYSVNVSLWLTCWIRIGLPNCEIIGAAINDHQHLYEKRAFSKGRDHHCGPRLRMQQYISWSTVTSIITQALY